MARGVNKVILVGNLGKDPETRYMPSGSAVTNLTLATSESWKDKQTGEQQDRTEWHKIAMFGRLAEIAAEYLRKGSQIYIEGKLRTRKWQDKEGKDRYTTEIVADEMQMLGSKGGGGASAGRRARWAAARARVGGERRRRRPRGRQRFRRAARRFRRRYPVLNGRTLLHPDVRLPDERVRLRQDGGRARVCVQRARRPTSPSRPTSCWSTPAPCARRRRRRCSRCSAAGASSRKRTRTSSSASAAASRAKRAPRS